MGKKLNIENPKLITEKIQWLKLYDNIPEKEYFTDKLKAPILVKEILEKNQFNKTYKLLFKPVLGVWNNFEEIKFEKLPNKFVLKTNHGCNMNYLVFNKTELINNKEEMSKLKDLTQNWLKCNYAFVSGFELQYKNIEPKLFAEPLYTGKKDRVTELGVYCFNGEPEYIQICTFFELNNRKSTKKYQFNTFYDKYWQIQEFSVDKKPCKILLPPIRHFYPVLKIAKELSKNFKFVRVDFLLANEDKDLYFQEMTFTPYSGFRQIYPEKYDSIIGKLLKIK